MKFAGDAGVEEGNFMNPCEPSQLKNRPGGFFSSRHFYDCPEIHSMICISFFKSLQEVLEELQARLEGSSSSS
ncbi:hypothetical protein TorRG33x02_289460 [Trema orientale]|uniref:Uncharacterized protein n=1 Tax=Trema orientale TaxID=63057 RepID=A0A2P5CD11_TREOI|nr:hypothetical protein TorRG33x02_289460 [Trema orientale]